VEELYSTRYQGDSFSLIIVGSGFHCLRGFFFFCFLFDNRPKAGMKKLALESFKMTQPEHIS
jgi:hypothetical protein